MSLLVFSFLGNGMHTGSGDNLSRVAAHLDIQAICIVPRESGTWILSISMEKKGRGEQWYSGGIPYWHAISNQVLSKLFWFKRSITSGECIAVLGRAQREPLLHVLSKEWHIENIYWRSAETLHMHLIFLALYFLQTFDLIDTFMLYKCIALWDFEQLYIVF